MCDIYCPCICLSAGSFCFSCSVNATPGAERTLEQIWGWSATPSSRLKVSQSLAKLSFSLFTQHAKLTQRLYLCWMFQTVSLEKNVCDWKWLPLKPQTSMVIFFLSSLLLLCPLSVQECSWIRQNSGVSVYNHVWGGTNKTCPGAWW